MDPLDSRSFALGGVKKKVRPCSSSSQKSTMRRICSPMIVKFSLVLVSTCWLLITWHSSYTLVPVLSYKYPLPKANAMTLPVSTTLIPTNQSDSKNNTITVDPDQVNGSTAIQVPNTVEQSVNRTTTKDKNNSLFTDHHSNQPRIRDGRRSVQLRKACTQLQLSNKSSNFTEIQRQLSHVIVFPKYKLLYCDIPKVGSTSWKRFFLDLHGHKEKGNPHVLTERHFKTLSNLPRVAAQQALAEYTSFVFVRNPYSRLLSAFINKMLSPGKEEVWRVKRVNSWLQQRDAKLGKRRSARQKMTFSDFVSYYAESGDRDIHWKAMSSICHPCFVDFDFIGHLETLEHDLKVIIDIIQAPRDISYPVADNRHYTGSSGAHTFRDYYLSLTARDLHALSLVPDFAQDLALFDYKVLDRDELLNNNQI
ncbi:carbohydrate sulfotransferase 10-like [Diadema setosum]|uniref:carbohydrate sulfotransferase 10-like n=1 Tax=Diadema setosum TaxID=31175 RepID=UPI003B3BA498